MRPKIISFSSISSPQPKPHPKGGGEYKQMCRSMSICMVCMISMFIYMFLCDYGVESSQKVLKTEVCIRMYEKSIEHIITHKSFLEK